MSLEDIGTSVGDALYRQIGRANGHVQRYRSLSVDVLEGESAYLVVFDAPGTEPDDVQVRYLDGNVKIRIERFREFRDGYRMRFPGRGMALDGEAELPSDAIVDPDAGTATLSESGTVRIEIPKDVSGTETEGSERADPAVATVSSDADEVAVDD
ncbi:Hsp20/alpha crystallin family protein [Natrarchaeobius chitinivorans]|uniref:Hsp20/alpha crystallin family protein n=1 Tax=Natrarchaeobius chitinivorans TaxID=1679083 RepID=A0A3N6NG64_NATCH|nr:Hsp20/alpha crystallin family protein [Natrarchaeobius chitinivorans]RQG97992.1 Hsp20/alpha crystallin family protein [Natrarchaeobius chitinivorans]